MDIRKAIQYLEQPLFVLKVNYLNRWYRTSMNNFWGYSISFVTLVLFIPTPVIVEAFALALVTFLWLLKYLYIKLNPLEWSEMNDKQKLEYMDKYGTENLTDEQFSEALNIYYGSAFYEDDDNTR